MFIEEPFSKRMCLGASRGPIGARPLVSTAQTIVIGGIAATAAWNDCGVKPRCPITGGNKVQARTHSAVDALIANAKGLEEAGAFAVVLEAVPLEAAKQVTQAIGIPTIGIGAGPHCDGQVLVSSEMLGLSAGPRPRYAKLYADLRGQIIEAARTFSREVATSQYPGAAHSYDWAIG